MIKLRALRFTASQTWQLSIYRCCSNSGKMQNLYIRYPSGSTSFNVAFHYTNEALGVNRRFNLSRNAAEPVSSFLTRLTQNVSKVLAMNMKKMKKKKKITNAGDAETPIVTVQLSKNGAIVSGEEICLNLLECNEMMTLSINGKTFNVVINSPWVDVIQLPSSILSGFPIYPSKFVGDSVDPKDCLYKWYKSSNKNNKEDEWLEVGSGFIYTPSVDDIGHMLKIECEPRRGHLTGPAVEAVSSCRVEAGPGECPFETRHAFTKDRAEGLSFRVTSYNILAGLYSDTDTAKNELFSYCPTYALDINYRKHLLVKEILGYNADVICLQEVDEHIFMCDLQPIFSLNGYDGVYQKKGNTVREGLACFINCNRFRLIEMDYSVLSTELSEKPYFASIWEKVRDNQPLLERIKEKPTTSQATILQSTDNPNDFLVVGNTHLYFHPDSDHIRLMQAGITILFLENVLKRVKDQNPGARVSLLFCGDFNSTPECGIYRLMTTGHVPDNVVDWRSNEEEAIIGLSLKQPFHLASACGTPQYTNYTVGFAACLDYIFYQTDNLNVKQIIPMYSEEELRRHTAIPSVVFPSDHVALVADLSFIPG